MLHLGTNANIFFWGVSLTPRRADQPYYIAKEDTCENGRTFGHTLQSIINTEIFTGKVIAGVCLKITHWVTGEMI